MKVRTFFLMLLLAAIAVFTLLNWQAILSPTSLSLGVADIQAPLGLIMLGLMVTISVLFLLYIVYLQTSVFLETRRHNKEMHANRVLTDQAEASRFTKLNVFLESEIKKQTSLASENRAALLARIEQLERELRLTIEQSTNSLSASLGELEDRVEKSLKP
ncbi:MAG: LapA family protein [Gammaproteobacteria bacterium]|nr:LapA family protein [Gammaproteobacteria bacterium]MBU0785420.1 LapA family protein [Gammaproteobacteria bacterium]MBU0813621.1 LapA family protein [Gammaproteobacteria bacterium]MBU1788908.1 LapA family protein [Gammaproteobacteria bacterium]